MHAPLFEAVPNFSEGKDNAKISRITGAIRAVPGIRILGLHSDPDHNRSVLTFAGEEDPMLSGALALAKACATELDLALQSGEHPRMGVLDVLPFVPLEGATMDDAVRLAHRAGETLGSLGFPVYLYGSAATNPHRQALPDVRRGGYEGVASRIRDPLWKPDYGPTTLDPHRGAVAVGARPFLVAFNAYLDTDEVEVARAVARRVRESGGGLPAVRALGFHV
nr:glutamate formimidoyltransferase [Rubrobacteraceae bacterium]